MEKENEKVEYGKSEVKEKAKPLTEVKVVKEGITQDDLLTKKKHIVKTEAYPKSDAIKE